MHLAINLALDWIVAETFEVIDQQLGADSKNTKLCMMKSVRLLDHAMNADQPEETRTEMNRRIIGLLHKVTCRSTEQLIIGAI